MQPIAAPLLQWFQANKRLLPFRQEPSAYHIWVSEIMLQQTRVAAAIPYYNRFIAALPTPADLAVCEPDALRKLWQGLGYYNRVNNMQKAARIVCDPFRERALYDVAVVLAKDELRRLSQRAKGPDADILLFQIALLEDESFTNEIGDYIAAGAGGAAACT